MSKKYLEALRSIGEILGDLEISADTMLPKIVLSGNRAVNYKIVEQALQRLEAIDNAKPSEALKKLECLYEDAKIESGWVKKHCVTYAEEFEHNDRIKPYYEYIKQTLVKAQKQEEENKRLEKKLGCPLDVLGKALLQNCFYDVYGNAIETDIGYMEQEGTTGIVMSVQEWRDGIYCGKDCAIYLKDYKKTWWLKEDKSE